MLKKHDCAQSTVAQMLSIIKIIDSVLFLQVRQVCEPEPCPFECSVGKEAFDREQNHTWYARSLFSLTLTTDQSCCVFCHSKLEV